MTSIKDAFEKRTTGPYSQRIQIKVVACGEVATYKAQDGETRKTLSVAVSDGKECIVTKVYDEAKFQKFKIGSCLALRDVIKKNEETRFLVVTRVSKVFMSSGVDVPESHKHTGELLINPPAADTVSIQVALGSPSKMRVSVSGKIIQDDAVRTVKVRDEDVDIKVITIEDNTQKAKVTLWRESVKTEARSGDFVTITDVVTNQYKGETSLSTTTRSKLQKIEPPLQKEMVEVVGICLIDGNAELLLADDSILTVLSELLQQGSEDITDLEGLTSEGSVFYEIERKGSEVLNIVRL